MIKINIQLFACDGSSCSGGCYGCSGCGGGCGGCGGSCGGCASGCYGCTGTCSGSCTGCSGTCSGGCSGCTGTCSGSCGSSCGGCSGCSGCGGACSSNCTGTCSSGCTSCTGCTGCTGTCTGGCGGSCTSSCDNACTSSSASETISNLGANIVSGGIIKSEDFNTLKSKIRGEIQRRSKTSNHDYKKLPEKDIIVDVEHILKIKLEEYMIKNTTPPAVVSGDIVKHASLKDTIEYTKQLMMENTK